MKATTAMILLAYASILGLGLALEATTGAESCGSCECSCPPNRKRPGKEVNPKPPSKPSPNPPSKPSPKPRPPSKKPPTPSPTPTTCSMDYKRLGSSCTLLLGGILGIGTQCCGLLKLDAIACLCIALDANVLGLIHLKISKLDAIITILTSCNCPVPKNLSCPSS